MPNFVNTSRNAILEKGSGQLLQKLPFVIYNKPDSNQLVGLFQQDDCLHLVTDFEESGFVFAPFDKKEIVLIPTSHSETHISNFEVNAFVPEKGKEEQKEISEQAKTAFKALVQKGIQAIDAGVFGKVVLSRMETFELPNLDSMEILQNLLNAYPTAFTYCFFHPKTGLWLGAFSEQLLKKQGAEFYTMAVAGTQHIELGKPIIWENKEKEEQQFVTDFILEGLKKQVAKIVVSNPYNLKAGNVMHIKTDINGILKEEANLKEILEILHPTPAVCGFPKAAAKEFILQNEGYNREYYSGFLGELNMDFKTNEATTDLYVNLRCMQITSGSFSEKAKANLYIGGGITKDSISEKEWDETVNKALTIKKILK